MLDDRDRRILALLQIDSNQPISDVADKVHLSLSACSRRIARLKEEGYIARQVVILDSSRMGVPTTLFVLIKTNRHNEEWMQGLRDAIRAIPEIVEAHRLTGHYDYVLKIILPKIEHYDEIYKRLAKRIDLSDISSFISIEALKVETAIPVQYA